MSLILHHDIFGVRYHFVGLFGRGWRLVVDIFLQLQKDVVQVLENSVILIFVGGSPLPSDVESLVGILNLLQKELEIAMPQDVLLEDLLVILLEDQVSLELLLKHRLNQKDPYLLDADDGLSDSSVVLDNSVEELPEGFGFLSK